MNRWLTLGLAIVIGIGVSLLVNFPMTWVVNFVCDNVFEWRTFGYWQVWWVWWLLGFVGRAIFPRRGSA